jgi:AcrR family transcriptional regulator
MARISEPPQAVETMTPAQRERRRRVLDAVIELVAAGRVEEMSMKDVSDRSGVALGTIYRYFSSRDHVAAAALLEWASTLDRRPGAGRAGSSRPGSEASAKADGGSMTERLVEVVRRGVRAYQRQPNFARLFILAGTSTDPFASECYAQMGHSVYATMEAALADLAPEDRKRVLDVVGAVWNQAMIEWVNDRKTIAQVYEAVESAVRLALAGFER